MEYIAQGRHSVLRVYIDHENGITVDDCEAASQQISAVLDVEDPIKNEYALEVSSPGLERPLFLPEHFARAQGQKIQVKLHTPVSGRRQFRGVVTAVEGQQLVLQCDNESITLPLADVAKANVIVELEKVNNGK